jgi:hypothetical protein
MLEDTSFIDVVCGTRPLEQISFGLNTTGVHMICRAEFLHKELVQLANCVLLSLRQHDHFTQLPRIQYLSEC